MSNSLSTVGQRWLSALLATSLLGLTIVGFGLGAHGQATDPSGISNVRVVSIGQNQATVAWTTESLTAGIVRYGLTSDYSDFIPASATTTAHQITISNLQPGTTYHYQVADKDDVMHRGSYDRTFTTLAVGQAAPQTPNQTPTADLTYGIISGIKISGLTTTEVIISWNTSVLAESVVRYGLTRNYNNFVSLTTSANAHQAILRNLQPGTVYHYQITAQQSAVSQSATDDLTFMTLSLQPGQTVPGTTTPTGDVQAPVISNIKIAPIDDSTMTISWDTDELATTNVSFGLTKDFQKTFSSTKVRLNHKVLLTDLEEGAVYYYQIYSKDAAGNKAMTKDKTFTVTGKLVEDEKMVPATITTIKLSEITATSVVVSWTTSELTKSELAYGKTSKYSMVKSSTKMKTAHQVKLTDLKPNTTYHYRISTVDADGNLTVSPDRTLVTLQ